MDVNESANCLNIPDALGYHNLVVLCNDDNFVRTCTGTSNFLHKSIQALYFCVLQGIVL